MQKRIWLWALYDFANSFGFASVVFYFGPWFIVRKGGSDLWMSGAVALATMIMFFTLPFLGHRSDRMSRRMPFLSVLTFLNVIALLALGFVTNMVNILTMPITLAVIALYLSFHFFYQSGLAFYNAFMVSLTENGATPEKVSGLGMGMGQLGNVIALLVLIPIVQHEIPFVGLTGQSAAFAIGALIFLLFAIPTLLFLTETSAAVRQPAASGRWKTLHATLEDLRQIRQYPGVLAYLITYYLFADAVLTITLFVTTYLDEVALLNDSIKGASLIAGTILGILGGLLSPYLVRLFGTRRRALSACIATWSVLIAAIALARSPIVVAIVIGLNGFAYGALFALSRAFYATLIPWEKQATFFSVYVLFERAASILGPLLWSAVAFFFTSFGPDRYRFSMFAMAVLVAISFFTLRLVREVESSNRGLSV